MGDVLTKQDVLDSLRRQSNTRLPLPKLQPVSWRKDTWILTEDWSFALNNLAPLLRAKRDPQRLDDVTIFIPRHFFCDLDSIPRVPFVYSFFKGYARTSAMVHDWFYATGIVDRDVADAVFYELMLLENVEEWRAKLIYWAVRAFGWRYYSKKRGVLDALMSPEVRDALIA